MLPLTKRLDDESRLRNRIGIQALLLATSLNISKSYAESNTRLMDGNGDTVDVYRKEILPEYRKLWKFIDFYRSLYGENERVEELAFGWNDVPEDHWKKLHPE